MSEENKQGEIKLKRTYSDSLWIPFVYKKTFYRIIYLLVYSVVISSIYANTLS